MKFLARSVTLVLLSLLLIQPLSISASEISTSQSPSLNTTDHFPYIVGIEGKFLPENTLSRAQAAMILARLMIDENGEGLYDETRSYSADFIDVPADAWFASAVGLMQQYAVIKGYDDGTFQPDREITRAEFATLISRFEPLETVSLSYPDLEPDFWAYPYLAHAVAKGYMSGYDDGTIQPNRPITRAETVKIVNRLLGRMPDLTYIAALPHLPLTDLDTGHWAFADVLEATYFHYYHVENGQELWLEEPYQPPVVEYPAFESDKLHFVFPDMTIQSPLTPLDLTLIDSIALHHMDHPTADFYEVERWHLNQGWSAFGYNFWIDFDGNVYVGRGWNRGAGVANQNSHILSIGFQGDYEVANTSMPEAQFQAGVELIKWLQEQVPTAQEIGGHGDFSATLCPGKYFPLADMVAAAVN